MDWKRCFLAGKFDEAQRNRTAVSYGRFNDFLRKFTEDFAPRLGHDHARKDLKNIQQEGNVESHNTAFKNLMITAGYAFPHTDPDDNLDPMEDLLIGIYQDSLKKPILDRIRNNGYNPYTLKEWMDRAAEVDARWRESFPFPFDKKPAKRFTSNQMGFRFANSKQINLTEVERADHMKNGTCFRCHQPGHISKFCPNRDLKKTNQNQNTNNRDSTPTRNPKDFAKYIRTFYQDLNEEQRAEFASEMQEQDFS